MKTIAPDGAQINVAPSNIREATWNPRRERNEEALDSLIESVRTVGILQPLVVRHTEDGLEVVCGHRRLSAAREARLETVPVIVRHVDVPTAYDMAMAENLQREDLTEIDEAEAYRVWLEHGQTVEEIALRVGRDRSHVCGRLKLLDLPEAAQEALKSGRLDVSVAVLIGRIPGQRQREEATDEILKVAHPEWDEDRFEPLSFAKAKRMIHDRYMLALELAPFDVNDRTLVPVAGACGDCQHRTGNQTDLFGDVVATDGDDVCTYPTCFDGKRAAAAERLIAAAKDEGLSALTAPQAAKAFPDGSGHLKWSSPWVEADGTDGQYRTKGKTWRAFVGKKPPEEFVAVDGQGNIHHLYRKKDVEALIAAKEEKARAKAAAKGGPVASPTAADRKRQAEMDDRVDEQALTDILAVVDAGAYDLLLNDGDALVTMLINEADGWRPVRNLRGLEDSEENESPQAYLQTLNTREKWGLLLDMALFSSLEVAVCYQDDEAAEERAFAVAKAFGFSIAQMREVAAAKVAAGDAAETEDGGTV
jgi:ParB/RepB/Spo0J family partition protein